MWWHADNATYGELLQGLAVSDNITGPYSYVDAYAPLGNWSQDFGLFVDRKDGRAYSLYSNGDRREGRDVYLTSFNENITALDEVIHRWDKYDLEAPTIVQTDKSYFALMSHKTGYRPNSEYNWQIMWYKLLISSRRCCFPCGQAIRTMVPALHRRSTQHPYIQLSIRPQPAHQWHQEDHISVHGRPMGFQLHLGVPLHLAPHGDR